MRRPVSHQALKGALLILVLAYVGVLAQDKSKVQVNRKVPNVRPPAAMPVFSDPPTTAEITRARVFEEPLLALGSEEPSAGENRELAGVLTAYLTAGVPDGTQSLERFLASHPQSPWRDSLLTDLGLVWRRTGHFSKAYNAWESAWQAAKNYSDQHGHAVADKALGEYIALNARLGRFDTLTDLLQEVSARDIHGSAWEQVSNAKQALWLMTNEPEHSFRCGPLGLDAVLAVGASNYKTPQKIQACPSTKRGTSLLGMRELAKEVGASMTMGKREPGADVIVPALVHWKVGHFAALVEKQGDRYLMKDPTFGDELWLTQAALDEEASGYFLFRTRALPDGWKPVRDDEGADIWGKGIVAGTDDSDVGGPDGGPDGDNGDPDGGMDGNPPGPEGPPPDSGPPGGPGGGPPPDDPGGSGTGRDPGPCPSCHPDDVGTQETEPANSGDGRLLSGDSNMCPAGMPTISVHRMLVSLTVRDVPLWYSPPKGPLVRFHLRYNQREAFQPQTYWYSNVGQRWTHEWLSYVTDDPSNANAAVTIYLRGGGQESATGYNAGTGSYSPNLRSQAIVTRTSASPIRYQRQMANGAIEVFGQADGAGAFPRKVFLTEIHDPRGNALTFTYDANLRLVAVTDALGQVTTLSYGNADPLKITQVTDPFGRSTTLSYDGQGRLQSITDILGLSSSFTYGSGDAVSTMTTPYGTTTATSGDIAGLKRWAEITDPIGGKQRVEYGAVNNLVNQPLPTGMNVFNDPLWTHHASVYWNKRAMEVAPGDPASATQIIWALVQSGQWLSSSVPLGIQRPLENKVWYSYQGGGAQTEGTVRRTNGIGRVLDDGSSQVSTFAYNSRGKVTQAIGPLGRETDYVYDATGLDVLQIKQNRGGTFDVVQSRTYNSQHRPLTIADAAGQTTTYTYNAAGQLATVTNAKGEVTTYARDANGYLMGVTGPLGASVTYAYDGYGRVNSVTDSAGYTVSLQYDAGGRVTRTTYPDSTYEQGVYDRLDLAQQRDRLGRWTTFTHNAARQLVAVRDSLGRTTSFDRCACGALDSIVDANGNRTHWDRDIEGRITTETRAGGSATHYAYEAKTSRLKQVTDRKGQVVTYSYRADGDLQQKTYTNAQVATANVSFTYDSAYNRVLTQTDGTGTTTYTYVPVVSGQLGAGNVATIDGPLGNDTIAYTYDELGRVVSQSINAVSQSVTYDALGRATAVTNALGAFGYVYVGATGRIQQMTYPNGQTSTYSYFGHTGDDRLQTMLHQRSDTTTISRFGYAFDTVGNIASWTRQVDATAPTAYQFSYDAADQILGATKQTTGGTPSVLARYRYTYDAAGNRTSEQIDDALIGATYNASNALVSTQPSGGLHFAGSLSEPAVVTVAGRPAAVAPDNTFSATVPVAAGTSTVAIAATDPSGNTSTRSYQVTTSGSSSSFTYDANGNLTSDGTRTFTWDAEDRLISVTIGAHVSTFTYDWQSRRVRMVETDSGTTTSDTRFVWCGPMICEARDSSGNTVTKRYFGQGVQDNGTALFYTRDHLGSIRELMDSAGVVRARYDYDPWGRRTKVSGDLDADFGFTGHWQHGPSGLTLALFRAYDPNLARWLSEDPIGSAESSLYGYVGGNPVSYIDPFGLDMTEAQKAAIAKNAPGWTGVPFKLGGTSKQGADCSGSISGILKESGADIGHMLSGDFKNSPLFSPATGPRQVGDVGWVPGHVFLSNGNEGPGNDAWSAHSATSGKPFGPAQSSSFNMGTPTWYRYKGASK